MVNFWAPLFNIATVFLVFTYKSDFNERFDPKTGEVRKGGTCRVTGKKIPWGEDYSEDCYKRNKNSGDHTSGGGFSDGGDGGG